MRIAEAQEDELLCNLSVRLQNMIAELNKVQ
jgi:hypothetical protein